MKIPKLKYKFMENYSTHIKPTKISDLPIL